MTLEQSISIAAPFTAGWETYSANPYYDTNGYAIGYGNHYYADGSTVDATDDPISEEDAYNLMAFFLQQNAAALLPQITVPLTDNQLAALTDLRYNAGTIGTDLLSLINSGADPATVGAQIEVTRATAGGVPNADLKARRLAESGLYQQPGGIGSSNIIAAAIGLILALVLIK